MLKTIIIILTLSFGLILTITAGEMEVHFDENASIEAIESGELGKPVFLFVTAPGCAPCKRMKTTTFREDTIVRLLNERFHPVKINLAETEEEHPFGMRQVPGTAFIGEDGQIKHHMYGYQSREDLLIQASLTEDYSHILEEMAKIYEAGDYDRDFLYNYIIAQTGSQVLNVNIVNEYLEMFDQEELAEQEKIEFLYRFSLVPGEMVVHYDLPSEKDDESEAEKDEEENNNTSAFSQPPSKFFLSSINGGLEFKLRTESYKWFNEFGEPKYFSYPLKSPDVNDDTLTYNGPVVGVTYAGLKVNTDAYDFFVTNRDKLLEYAKDTAQVDWRIKALAQYAASKASYEKKPEYLQKALMGYNAIDNDDSNIRFNFDGQPVRDMYIWGLFAHELELGLERNARRTYYLSTGEYDKYEELMDAYIEENLDNAQALWKMAYRYYHWYTDDKKLNRALTWAEKASELEDDWEAVAIKALLAKKLGNTADATALKDETLARVQDEKDNNEELLKKVKDMRID